MRKYVGFAKDVGQILKTARTNVIKYSEHKKVFTARLDTSQEQTLDQHRWSSTLFFAWLG